MSTTEAKWSIQERRTARNWYWWLWLSPLVTVPSFGLFILNTLFGDQTEEILPLGVMPSVAWYLVLLVPAFFKRSEFVRWHGRQALLLAGVMAIVLLVYAIIANSVSDAGVVMRVPFLILIAFWFFGTLLSQRQAARGDCSLMRWLGKGKHQ